MPSNKTTEQVGEKANTEGLRVWTVPVCNGCGGVMPTSCTCEKSHAKTGLSVPVVAVPDLVETLRSEALTHEDVVQAVENVRSARCTEAVVETVEELFLAALTAIGLDPKDEEGDRG